MKREEIESKSLADRIAPYVNQIHELNIKIQQEIDRSSSYFVHGKLMYKGEPNGLNFKFKDIEIIGSFSECNEYMKDKYGIDNS